MTNNNKQKNLRDQILNLRSLIDLREKGSDKPDKEGQMVLMTNRQNGHIEGSNKEKFCGHIVHCVLGLDLDYAGRTVGVSNFCLCLSLN